jgi:hypothetical protein
MTMMVPWRPKASALRPALSSSLINQEIIDLLSTFDRSNKPTSLCASTCPSLT